MGPSCRNGACLVLAGVVIACGAWTHAGGAFLKLLLGDVGTGKTHMASALCALACERRLDREAALIGKARLLVIDELGFLPLDADGARLLFQVFADAYERQSVEITTNLEFSRWGSVFGDDQMAAAVIDRIVHHGRLVQFRGESYRVRHALMQEG